MNASRLLNLAAALFAGITLCSCAYSIHEVQVSDFQPYANPAAGHLVAGRGSQLVILNITGNSHYIEDAKIDLEKQCRGTITGITTQLSTDLGFFSWHNRALLQGYCYDMKSAGL